MEFRVIHKDEMIIVGKKITISFADDYISQVKELWTQFQNDYGKSIQNVIDDKPIVLYFEQGLAGQGKLSYLLGLHVSKENDHTLETIHLPKSDYACFSIKGQSMSDIIEAWNIIMKLQVEQDTGIALEIYHLDHELESKRTLECLVSIV